MKWMRFTLAAITASALSLSSQAAIGEELRVATFLPPQHHINTGMFAWFEREIEEQFFMRLFDRFELKESIELFRIEKLKLEELRI